MQKAPHLLLIRFLKSTKTSLQTFPDFTFFTKCVPCRSQTSLVVTIWAHRGVFTVSLRTKSTVLKNGIVHVLDSSHGSNHLRSQAVISGSGWKRQLMASDTEKLLKKIQLSTPASVWGRSWKAHAWHEAVREFPNHSLQ